MGQAEDAALIAAAQKGDEAAVRAALGKGANIKCKDGNGNMPLHLAAWNGHAGICTALCERGADVNAKGYYDYTPLHNAASNGHAAICTALCKRGADVNAKEKAGMAPLDRAKDDATRAALRAAITAAKVTAVPADVAALLTRLSLASYGAALCDKLGMTCAADAALLTEADLEQVGMRPLESRKLLAAAGPAPAPTPAAAPAEAPRASAGVRPRIRALCVGIDAYAAPVPGRLANAAADARAVHKALSALPGASATLVTDCTKAALERALCDFRDGAAATRGMRVAADAPDVPTLALFFFAGHGLQVSGRNYLVPSDFAPPAARADKLEPLLRDTARACVSLDLVEEMLEDAGAAAAAVWLDCCRDVPDFLAAAGATRSSGTRALSRGMGDARPALRDVMLTFATAPGTVALDRSSRLAAHSPFTAALLKALAAPRRLLELAPFLTDEVAADSGGQQRPHVGGSYGVDAGNLVLG